jgi:hypothetical protein
VSDDPADMRRKYVCPGTAHESQTHHHALRCCAACSQDYSFAACLGKRIVAKPSGVVERCGFVDDRCLATLERWVAGQRPGVDKFLARMRTLSPRCSRCRTKAEPMKPVAPVMRAFNSIARCSSSARLRSPPGGCR